MEAEILQTAVLHLHPKTYERLIRLPKQAERDGCDYREFRPYVNQHPYGTLIADLVDHTGFVVGQAYRSLKTGSVCLAQSTSASKCREFESRRNRFLDQQKFGQGKQT